MSIVNFLLRFEHLKTLKITSIVLTVVSFFTYIYMPTNLQSLIVILIFLAFALFCRLVMKIEAIRERFEFADVLIDHKGIKNPTKFVVLYDKEKEGKPSLLIKEELNKQSKIMLEAQRKTTNFEMVLSKEDFDNFIMEEGFIDGI